jgi:predicted  nucleic acid-binding Zn-ribbon protein
MTKKAATIVITVAMMCSLGWTQTHADSRPSAPANINSCGLGHEELQEELKELNVHASRMESRIVMIRNSAGTVQDPQVRNALQVNADMWQDEVDYLKQHMQRLQTAIDRCEAQEKIRQNTK